MKPLNALTAAVLSVAGFGVYAQAPAAAPAAAEGPAKIGVIAFEAAVTGTNEFQRNYADLQKKYEPKRSELKTLNDQIETLKKQLQTQGDTLSDAERESRTRSVDEKEKQMQREQEDDQNDFQQDIQDTFNGVAQKVGALLVDYAKQHGFTLVLDGGNQQTQFVMYASASTDLTKTILDAYNTKSGVPAPANPTQGAPAVPRPSAPRTTPQN
jgi:outer membrane protein